MPYVLRGRVHDRREGSVSASNPWVSVAQEKPPHGIWVEICGVLACELKARFDGSKWEEEEGGEIQVGGEGQ